MARLVVGPSTTLKLAFTAAVRQRGEPYVDEIEPQVSAGGRITAEVWGQAAEAYEVSAWPAPRRPDVLQGGCTCPVGLDRCKHLWATLRAVDAAGMWPADVPAPMALQVVDVAERGAPPVEPPPPRRAAAAASAKVASWRARLGPEWELAAQLAAAPSAPPRLEYLLVVVRPEPHMLALLDDRVRLAVVSAQPGRADGTYTRDLLGAHDRAAAIAAGGEDAEVLTLLYAVGAAPSPYAPASQAIEVDVRARPDVLPRLAATGRLRLAPDGLRLGRGGELEAVTVMPGLATLVVRLEPAKAGRVRATGRLLLGDEVLPLEAVREFVGGGVIVGAPGAARFVALDVDGIVRWWRLLVGGVELDAGEVGELLERTSTGARPPRLDLEAIGWRTPELAPIGRIDVGRGARGLEASARLLYGEATAPRTGAVVVDPAARTVVRRRLADEAAALVALRELGGQVHRPWAIAPTRLRALIEDAAARGWEVWFERGRVRASAATTARVRSGVDWFDLSVTIADGAAVAGTPELLAAVKAGTGLVRLSDGSSALLPPWLEAQAALLAAARPSGDGVRFAAAEGVVLGALVDALPEVQVDRAFAALRTKLAGFAGAAPRDAPRGFGATLRDYQRDGLGWLHALGELGLGGCLADDMGLGKTVQVLAYLAGRRGARGRAGARGPSLVVAPRSLGFHWQDEARRFAPQLRTLEWHGAARAGRAAELGEVDLVVTTYATLARDVEQLAAVPWDVVILDEAQAIKNPRTGAAKAARALSARHRLALTGTPIENRVDDLASIFEFLSPGLLGRPAVLKALAAAPSATVSPVASRHVQAPSPSDAARLPHPPGAATVDAEVIARREGERALAQGLGRVLRPFLLRRTKATVLTELPAKTEQLISVRLEGAERKRYDELRAHYRASLLPKVEAAGGVGKRTMAVLEALLRLRQAALHPGLLDPAQAGASSAKLEALLEHLGEVVASGHRALVFSQFTTLLAIVAARLDKDGIAYQSLDGQTRDRRARVAAFQGGDAPVFLLSLKAGGTGLNLTAADHVFLLDPWWNPAVEAQAIDRVHRLGQARPVAAYRLVAEDTVEEKVLALQAHKRALADGLFEDAGVVARLTAADLRALL